VIYFFNSDFKFFYDARFVVQSDLVFFVDEPALAELALAGTVAVADGHVLYRSIRLCPSRRHGTTKRG